MLMQGVDAFRASAGVEPDVVLFATSMWDIATWMDQTQILESEDIDDLAFADWMTNFKSALDFIKVSSSTVPVSLTPHKNSPAQLATLSLRRRR